MTENEMVERVAAAMKKVVKDGRGNMESFEGVLAGSLGDVWFYIARAAIESMREPTEAMVNAAVGLDDPGCRGFCDEPGDPYIACDHDIAWRAMIDESLKTEATPSPRSTPSR